MFVDNKMMRYSIKERLTQLHYVEINDSEGDFSRRLFTFDIDSKWKLPYVSLFIKPYKSHTSCIRVISDENESYDHARSEDELYVFQNYVKEELGTYYYNLKLLTVVIADHPYRHLKANDNTVAIKDGKICRRTFFDRELKKDLKALSSCYNYARAKMIRSEVLDSFYGGYRVQGAYLLCAILAFAYWNMSKWNLEPLSVHGLFYQKNILSLVSYMFMHGGISHLVGNIIALLVIGRGLESKIGLTKFMSIFLSGGILSGLLATAYRYDTLNPIATVGASGAIFALLGAWIVVSSYDFNCKDLNIVNFLIDTLVGAGYLYMCSKNENVDNAVHVAGFLCGMAIIIAIENMERIGKDEAIIKTDAYIRERQEEFAFFNKSAVEKAKIIENKEQNKGDTNDVPRDIKSEWIRI